MHNALSADTRNVRYAKNSRTIDAICSDRSVRGDHAPATALQITLRVNAFPCIGSLSVDAANTQADRTMLFSVHVTPENSTRACPIITAVAVADSVRRRAYAIRRMIRRGRDEAVLAGEATGVTSLAHWQGMPWVVAGLTSGSAVDQTDNRIDCGLLASNRDCGQCEGVSRNEARYTGNTKADVESADGDEFVREQWTGNS